MVPGYVEISHFRAPYKDSYVGSFGAFGDGASPRQMVTEAVEYLSNLLRTLSENMRGKQHPCIDAARRIVCARRLVLDRSSFWSQETIGLMESMYRSGMAEALMGDRRVIDDLIYQLAYEAIPLVTGQSMTWQEAEPLVRAMAVSARLNAGGMPQRHVTMQRIPSGTDLTAMRVSAEPRQIRPVGPSSLPSEPMIAGDPFITELRSFGGVAYNAYANPEAVVTSVGDYPIAEVDDIDQQFPAGAIYLMEAGSSDPFSVWVKDRFLDGYGVVYIETAEGGVYAPTNQIGDIAALQTSFGSDMVVVIAEPLEGWQTAAGPGPGGEKGAAAPNYLLYGGIAVGAVALLGLGYLIMR